MCCPPTGGSCMCCQQTLTHSFTGTSWWSCPRRSRLPTATIPTTARDFTPPPLYECWRTWTEGCYLPAEGVIIITEQKGRQCYALPTRCLVISLEKQERLTNFGAMVFILIFMTMENLGVGVAQLGEGWCRFCVAWKQVFFTRVHCHISITCIFYLISFNGILDGRNDS